MAGETGIEPATFGFGDQRYYQLSYSPKLINLLHNTKQ
jgi:hypothetical protein